MTGGPRRAFDDVRERIRQHLQAQDAPAKGMVVFASTTGRFVRNHHPRCAREAAHRMHVGSVPHLYPLARLNDQYPRYAALLVDTNTANLYVFALGAKNAARRHPPTRRRRSTQMGGWSQALLPASCGQLPQAAHEGSCRSTRQGRC
jgi:hypothetical protein